MTEDATQEHIWEQESRSEEQVVWRCSACKRRARHLLGILCPPEEDREAAASAPPPPGKCKLEKLIQHHEAELARLKLLL